MRTQISNDPITGWDRYFDNYLFVINERERIVSIGGDAETMYNGKVAKSKSFQFTATDEHMVDVNGNVVEEGGVMTEYEFYIALADTSIGVNAQRAAAIQKLDQSNRFDV